MTQLTADCLDDIFEYLRNDHSSLFSCLRANRLWCRLVIHLIWRDPFSMKLKENSLSKIIQTYISCLPDTSKQQIINKINNNTEEITNDQSGNFQRPLFVYPKYLQNLDLENFSNAIRIWHKNYDKSYDETIPNFTISKLLIEIIFKECFALTRLNINIWDRWSIPLTEMNFDLLFNREDGKNALINLNHFKFRFLAKAKSEGLQKFHQIIVKLFKNIEKNSINIRFLEVYFRMHRPPNEIDQVVGNLIKAQKDLRACKIIEYWDPKKPSIYNVLMNNNSLTYLNLSLSYFHESFVEGLLVCKNLKTLELLRCPEMPSHLLESPLRGSFSIKHLKVVMSYPDTYNESLIALLRMCNINLRKLFVDGADASIIDAICLYNSQLTHLSLIALHQIFDPPQSLSALKNLTLLKLGKFQHYIFGEHTLPYFIDSLPSIQHLHLHFNIDVIPLKFFLDECKIPLKSLEFHQSHNQEDEVFNALINYKKLNQNICEEIRLFMGRPHTFSSNALKESMKYIKVILDGSANYDLW